MPNASHLDTWLQGTCTKFDLNVLSKLSGRSAQKSQNINIGFCSFAIADATDLVEFADGSLDVVSCASGLFIFSDPARYDGMPPLFLSCLPSLPLYCRYHSLL